MVKEAALTFEPPSPSFTVTSSIRKEGVLCAGVEFAMERSRQIVPIRAQRTDRFRSHEVGVDRWKLASILLSRGYRIKNPGAVAKERDKRLTLEP